MRGSYLIKVFIARKQPSSVPLRGLVQGGDTQVHQLSPMSPQHFSVHRKDLWAVSAAGRA